MERRITVIVCCFTQANALTSVALAARAMEPPVVIDVISVSSKCKKNQIRKCLVLFHENTANYMKDRLYSSHLRKHAGLASCGGRGCCAVEVVALRCCGDTRGAELNGLRVEIIIQNPTRDSVPRPGKDLPSRGLRISAIWERVHYVKQKHRQDHNGSQRVDVHLAVFANSLYKRLQNPGV